MLCSHRMCNQINTTSTTSGAGTAYPPGAPGITPVFSGVQVTRSLISCMFCRSLFVLLYVFLQPLCCLSFDLRILITPLVSSNSFYISRLVIGISGLWDTTPPSRKGLSFKTDSIILNLSDCSIKCSLILPYPGISQMHYGQFASAAYRNVGYKIHTQYQNAFASIATSVSCA